MKDILEKIENFNISKELKEVYTDFIFMAVVNGFTDETQAFEDLKSHPTLRPEHKKILSSLMRYAHSQGKILSHKV